MRKPSNIFGVVLTLFVPVLVAAAVEPGGPAALGTPALLAAGTTFLAGHVTSEDGISIAGARVQAGQTIVITDDKGDFRVLLRAGECKLSVSAVGYAPLTLVVPLRADTELAVQLAPSSTTTVVADTQGLALDPSANAYNSDELITTIPGSPAHRCRSQDSRRRPPPAA